MEISLRALDFAIKVREEEIFFLRWQAVATCPLARKVKTSSSSSSFSRLVPSLLVRSRSFLVVGAKSSLVKVDG